MPDVQEPIYKAQDGRIFKKSQLISAGYTDDRIASGLSGGKLSVLGDTDTQGTYQAKDGREFSNSQLLLNGYSQDRIDQGVKNGLLSKKKVLPSDSGSSDGNTPPTSQSSQDLYSGKRPASYPLPTSPTPSTVVPTQSDAVQSQPLINNDFTGAPKPQSNNLVTTNDGVSFGINNLPVPDNAKEQIATTLQSKLNTKTQTPDDINTIAEASGKSPLAVWTYVNEGAVKGAAVENNQYVADQKQKITDYINSFNQINKTEYNPDEVMSTADNLNNFLNVVKTKNINPDVPRNPDFAATDQTAVRTLPTNLKTPLPFDISDDIINQVVQKTVSELPKDQAIDKISQILNPKDYAKTKDMTQGLNAMNDEINNNTSSPLSIFKNSIQQQSELFNYQKGISELKYNDALKQNALNKISQGTIDGNQNLVQEGRTDLSNVDDNVVDKYPSLLKQQIAEQVNDFIAKKSGVVQGYDAQTINDYKEKVFGTSTSDRLDAMQQLGILDDPKKKDIAESMAGNSTYFANNSILGSVVPNFLQPFGELGLSLQDMTGSRGKADILSDKIKDDLFPKDFSGNNPDDPNQLQLKNSIQYSRNILNTTANLAGMLAIATATEGVGTGVGISSKVAQRLGAYTSFGLPSFDASLKDAPASIVSEPAKYLYATVNSIANAEGGRFLDLGKISRIPGVSDEFAKIANGLSDNTITEKVLSNTLDAAQNKYVDFAVKYGKNVTKGAATMAYFNIANNITKMAFGDDEAKQNLIPQAGHAFLDGILGMSIMGGFGAAADMSKEKNTSFKGGIYTMALNHDAAADVFKAGLDNNTYTNAQYNEKMRILNTATAAKNALDATISETGAPLDVNQKSVYVANKTAQAVLESKANQAGIPEETRNNYLQQAKQLADQSTQTLDGLKFTPTLLPLYDLYDAEKKVNDAQEKYNPSDKSSADELESASQNYNKLYSDYLANNSNKPIEVNNEAQAAQAEVPISPETNSTPNEGVNKVEQPTKEGETANVTGQAESVNNDNALLQKIKDNGKADEQIQGDDLTAIKSQSLSATSSLNNKLGSEDLTTDIISNNPKEDIQKAIDDNQKSIDEGNFNYGSKETLQNNIDLLKKGLDKNGSADNTTPTEVTGITPLEDQAQKQQDNKGTVPTSIEPIGQGDAVAPNAVLGKVEPIGKLGGGENIYFKSDKYRVNDSKDGKVLLNVNDKTDNPFPAANIEFDNANEAVDIANKLQDKFPKGVPEALDVEKYVEQLRAEPKEQIQPISTKEVKGESPIDQKYKEDLHNSIQRELKLDFVPNEKLLEGRNADGLRDKQKDIKKRLSVLKTLMKSIDC